MVKGDCVALGWSWVGVCRSTVPEFVTRTVESSGFRQVQWCDVNKLENVTSNRFRNQKRRGQQFI